MTRVVLCLFLIVLVAGSHAYGQSSNRAFFYRAVGIQDSTNVEQRVEDFMVLWAGTGYSVYESYYQYQRDSVSEEMIKKSDNNPKNLDPAALQAVISMKKPVFKEIVHKSSKGEQTTVYSNLFFDNYVYTQPLALTGWKIEDEYKEILGFKCQKAGITYSGRDFVAWFAEEIPLQDGPYVFNGLPGLILQVEDTKGFYKFELIGIENSSIEMDKRVLRNPIALSKKQFFLTKNALYNDVRKALLAKPNGVVTDEQIRKVQMRYDKANNPLELVVE